MTDPVPIDRATSGSRPRARTPPHDLTAEESLLGAMLLTPNAITAAAEHITPNDFYKPAHAHIYQAILTLWAHGQPADTVTVADHLTQTGLITQIGGPATLITLQNTTPATSNAASYAQIIHNLATRRHLIGIAAEIAELGYQGAETARDLLDQAENHLYSLTAAQHPTDMIPVADVLTRAVSALESRADGKTPPGILTGLADLDRYLGGLGPGCLVTVAARPGAGKTQAGTAIGLSITEHGTPTLFVSAEMSEPQMGERLLANLTNVGLDNVRAGNLSQDHWVNLGDQVRKASTWPLYLLTQPGPGLADIRAAARRLAAKERRPPVVIVDYLQLLRAPKAENRNNEVAKLSWGLKELALSMGTVVIMLSQLSRESERRGDKRPVLSDLRDSGSIEQDSDIVIGLYRDEMYNEPTDATRNKAELIVLKNRHGARGTAHVHYNPATGRFMNIERHHNGGDF